MDQQPSQSGEATGAGQAAAIGALELDDLLAENRALRERIDQLERRNASWRRYRALVLPTLPLLILLVLGYSHRWTADDAFIDFRVVRQILAGHGPVFNAGERVEAYTSPIWVLLLTVWGLVGASIEIGAVIMGLLFTLAGLALGTWGAWRLIERPDRDELPGSARPVNPSAIRSRPEEKLLPIGALVFVAVPAVWDFTTSGLETGLIFGWLGLTFWLLASIVSGSDRAPGDERATTLGRRLAAAFVIGLGPLVRPDLALFSVAFLVALFSVDEQADPARPRLGRWASLLLAAGALPVAYEIFRMGYFAALEPNTALAKEGTAADWSRGGAYLGDFVETYVLWVPLVGLLWLWAKGFLGRWSARDWSAAAVWLAPAFGAAAGALYVVRVGGDFMHGRFLLPSFFGALLPVLVVRVRLAGRAGLPEWLSRSAAGILVAWALACGLFLRVPYKEVGPSEIADERGFYVQNSGNQNPVTIVDHQADPFAGDGVAIHRQSLAQRRVVLPEPDTPDAIKSARIPLAAWLPPSVNLAVSRHFIGMSGYNAGVDVFMVDRYGLADPIASRFAVGPNRGRPGHEKDMPYYWVIAHVAAPSPGLDNPDVTAARAALHCGGLGDVIHAVDDPLTIGRFVENVVLAPRLTALRFPANAADARKQLCGGA